MPDYTAFKFGNQGNRQRIVITECIDNVLLRMIADFKRLESGLGDFGYSRMIDFLFVSDN